MWQFSFILGNVEHSGNAVGVSLRGNVGENQTDPPTCRHNLWSYSGYQAILFFSWFFAWQTVTSYLKGIMGVYNVACMRFCLAPHYRYYYMEVRINLAVIPIFNRNQFYKIKFFCRSTASVLPYWCFLHDISGSTVKSFYMHFIQMDGTDILRIQNE